MNASTIALSFPSARVRHSQLAQPACSWIQIACVGLIQQHDLQIPEGTLKSEAGHSLGEEPCHHKRQAWPIRGHNVLYYGVVVLGSRRHGQQARGINLGPLVANIAHDNEHSSSIVMLMRMAGVRPPPLQ